jgi:hypothetical protein
MLVGLAVTLWGVLIVLAIVALVIFIVKSLR